MISLCFVCLGNICRSPTAEGVMIHLIEERGLQDQIKVDSAGTASYHTGEPADGRSAQAAKRRGIHLPSRARQFKAEDFDRFDYVLACDNSNFGDLKSLARGGNEEKLFLLLDFDTENPKGSSVPDPYYGGGNGFELVLDLCESACSKLLDHIVDEHDLSPQ
jgi:low molecular weight protein-tyrosine phosphatase